MKQFLQKCKKNAIMSSALLGAALTPTAHAYTSTEIIFLLCASLLDVFFYAGILLLVWAVVQLILAIKNEDAESKVQASSQIALAITLIGFTSIFDALKVAVGL